ncbi:MAG: GerMN domain-containing protein [bacterium]|nr:GerMN domain-containing protein [bacterium]
MQKNVIIVIVLAIVIVVLGAIFLWPQNNTQTPPIDENNINPPPAGLEITSPKPGDTVVSPLKISGSVKGEGWTGFEGQVGIVKLFDSSNKELAFGILTATQDWMKLPTPFETTLFFDYPGDGEGKLVFYNENPSGEAQRDQTYTMPVKLAKSSGAKTTVKVYFSNTKLENNLSCSTVFYAERNIPKTEGIARAALEQLIQGPINLEKDAGFFTNINTGVKVQSLVIKNGVAKVDFNQELQQGVAGSCKVTAIRAQIEQTLKQFPTVKSVVISINGKTDDILQP